jgi:hypothetical protein
MAHPQAIKEQSGSTRIEPGRRYRMKHRVETLDERRSRYAVKAWAIDEPEPSAWQVVYELPDQARRGSALLIAHYTDVTFHHVRAIPV